MSTNDFTMSIVMPALNEEANIAGTIEDVVWALRENSILGEIIVVNDGSTDRTAEVVESLMAKYPFVRTLTNSTPNGIGGSFWKGVKSARGEIVTLIPSDGEIIAGEVLRYVPLMDHVDILVPFTLNKEVRTWQRRLISITYKAIINLSFGLLLNYMNGAVVYRRVILDGLDLRSPGFFYQTELLIKTIKRGYLFAEVPSGQKVRKHGGSTALKPKSFYNVAKGYITTMLAIYFFDIPKKIHHPSSVTFKRRQALEEIQRETQALPVSTPPIS